MDRVELKKWAKEKIKGHIGELLIAIIIASLISNITIGANYKFDGTHLEFKSGYNIGIIFYFVQVGLTYYMVKFIKDEQRDLKDLFKYSNDFARIFITGLLESIFTFLWALLLIIPGIIKAIGYSLTTFILADDNYKELSYKEILMESENMMQGHKMDYFMLKLSFIGWHFLAIFTLGLLEIWIIPYENTTSYKFLNDVKENYEKAK